MNLLKYNSLKPFPSSNLNQLLDDFTGRGVSNYFGKESFSTSPSVNVIENENSFQIDVAAPGLEKGDFHVEVENEYLTISANKEYTKEESEEGRFTRREFNYGSFKRSFHLGDDVNAASITASYKDGILSIVLPKSDDATPKKKTIDIS